MNIKENNKKMQFMKNNHQQEYYEMLGRCIYDGDSVQEAIDKCWEKFGIKRMKVAYIAHPISGDVEENLKKIRAIVREINLTEPDVVPFVPYYADCVSMFDSNPEERARGIKNDTELFSRGVIDELWLCGDTVSRGMINEIDLARTNFIAVLPKSKGTREWLAKYIILTT